MIEAESEKVEWNMANLLNMELARLRTAANTYYLKGNYGAATDCLNIIWMTAIHVMTPEQRKAVESYGKKLNLSLMIYRGRSSFNSSEKENALFAEYRIKKLFPRYNALIMDCLFEHGFLGGIKKDAARMIYKDV